MNQQGALQVQIIYRLYANHLDFQAPFIRGNSIINPVLRVSIAQSISEETSTESVCKSNDKVKQKQGKRQVRRPQAKTIQWYGQELHYNLQQRYNRQSQQTSRTSSPKQFYLERVQFCVDGELIPYVLVFRKFLSATEAEKEYCSYKHQTQWVLQDTPKQHMVFKHVIGSREIVYLTFVFEDFIPLADISTLTFGNDPMGEVGHMVHKLRQKLDQSKVVCGNCLAFTHDTNKIVWLPFVKCHSSFSVLEVYSQLFKTCQDSKINLETIWEFHCKKQAYKASLYHLYDSRTNEGLEVHYSLGNKKQSFLVLEEAIPGFQQMVRTRIMHGCIIQVSETQYIKLFEQRQRRQMGRYGERQFIMTREFSKLAVSKHFYKTSFGDDQVYYFYVKKYKSALQLAFSALLLRKLALDISKEVLALHQKGVIHGDVKPANIVLDTEEDKFKLIDFGQAKRINQDSSQKSVVLGGFGSIKYMSHSMRKAINNKSFPVNLYDNDLFCLVKTIHVLADKFKLQPVWLNDLIKQSSTLQEKQRYCQTSQLLKGLNTRSTESQEELAYNQLESPTSQNHIL